jgi:hypothetical protein
LIVSRDLYVTTGINHRADDRLDIRVSFDDLSEYLTGGNPESIKGIALTGRLRCILFYSYAQYVQ